MQLKRKIGVVLAALGIMAGTFVASAPNALASPTETKTAWAECGSLPSKLRVDIEVVKNLDNNNRHISVHGVGYGYNGYQFHVTGPSVWQYDYLVYHRTTLMRIDTWYGPASITGLSWQGINWTARIYYGSASCDVFLFH